MKITEMLKENDGLEEIIPLNGTKTLKEVSELREIKRIKKINAYGVASLVSLEGCPEEVDGLWCNETSITTLKGGPKKANKINCSDNKHLISLEGCPEKLDALWCENTSITSLKGGPKKATKIDCDNNKHLISLEGCPEELDILWCVKTRITSLRGGPKKIIRLVLDDNPQLILHNVWEDLHYCNRYDQEGIIHKDSGLLGLLRIQKLKEIQSTHTALNIVSKYVPLRTMSDIIRCKQELIDAGFKSNAIF